MCDLWKTIMIFAMWGLSRGFPKTYFYLVAKENNPDGDREAE